MAVYTLITGASSGIGKAMAEYCGSLGMNLLLVSLPGEGLGDVARQIAGQYHVHTDFLETDLSSLESPEAVYSWVSGKKYPVNILVNNAGLAGTVVFENTDLPYIDQRLLVNIRALVMLTRLFLPDLKKHDKAHILNVGSLSAFFSIPYKSLYSATKSFVVNFSRGVRYELKETPVKISVVCPNGVKTNPVSHARVDSHGIITKLTTLSAKEVAMISIDEMLNDRFLIIPGIFNRMIYVISKIIPLQIKQSILSREFLKELKVP
jgi:short-subunit dehydrogenase